MKNSYTQQALQKIISDNPNEPEFIQAVTEVFESISELIDSDEKYQNNKLLERIAEPERVVMFRVPWVDDAGEIQVNKGYRVQFNSAIGPYKGGLRWHPSVNLSILKFLGFEQIFKNALTGIPMGGGKGGSNFDPHGKSDGEIMRFAQSFMSELFRHIGAETDVPAGDIGVGGREIGYLFGMYKKLRNEFTGVLTGKGLSFGGSRIRPEATGYGLLYFVREMLAQKDDSLEGKTVLISGAGNVAQYAAQKAIHLGGKVVTMSDSGGFIHDPEGIDEEKLAFIMELKNVKRGRIKEYAERFSSATYHEGQRPWSVPADVALPCATQNEIELDDAQELIKNGISLVAEGANMPTTPQAIEALQEAMIPYAPGKASNAGGVSVSGLEMAQNAMKTQWSREEVDAKLQEIMRNIHETVKAEGMDSDGNIDYMKGANIAGFKKVADAMIAQGVV